MISFEALVEKYIPDPKPTERIACEANIACECGRRSCMGYTVSINTWYRKMRQVEDN